MVKYIYGNIKIQIIKGNSNLTLYRKYKRATRIIMGITASIFVYVLNVVYPWLTAQTSFISQTLLFVVALGASYTIFFSVIMTIYEKYIWRLINPKYDYNGYWKMKITYEFLERKTTKRNVEKIELPYTFESVFKIEQSLFDLHFTEGFSAPNETWTDKSLRITENGFNMSYEINRSDKKPSDYLPSRTLGYEEILVTEKSFWGKPIYLEGRHYHVALPDVPLYRGTTKYEKISNSEYSSLLENMRNNIVKL